MLLFLVMVLALLFFGQLAWRLVSIYVIWVRVKLVKIIKLLELDEKEEKILLYLFEESPCTEVELSRKLEIYEYELNNFLIGLENLRLIKGSKKVWNISINSIHREFARLKKLH